MIVLTVAAYAVGGVVSFLVLAYAGKSIAQTASWYALRRHAANKYFIHKGLTSEELRDRIPGVWESLDREWNGDGEIARYMCTASDGTTLLFYFVDNRLFSWHLLVEDEPGPPEPPSS